MRKMLREVVASARAWLAETLRALAASGFEEQEAGKRFAAPKRVGWDVVWFGSKLTVDYSIWSRIEMRRCMVKESCLTSLHRAPFGSIPCRGCRA